MYQMFKHPISYNVKRKKYFICLCCQSNKFNKPGVLVALTKCLHAYNTANTILDEPRTESIELKNLDRGTSADTENEESALCSLNPAISSESKAENNKELEKNKPWHTLVSYVDELTVGGRKNSKGQYVDGMGTFPYFGKNKTPKVPHDCFPQHCYQK